MNSSNSQCKVRQCFDCEEIMVSFCLKCNQNLCGPCRTKHLNDLSEPRHETVIYRDKPSNIDIEVMCRIHFGSSCIWYCDTCKLPLCADCETEHRLQWHPILRLTVAYSKEKRFLSHFICTIRSENLCKSRAFMVEIQSDVEKLSTKLSTHKHLSKIFTKAQKLKQLIDKVVFDKTKCLLFSQNQIMKSHIARIQKYEYRYEESARNPTQFISFLKTTWSNIQSGPNLAQSIHLSLTESINVEDVIRFLCAFTLSDGEKRRLKNESLLELVPNPELQQSVKLSNTSGCLHISRVRQDQFWVSDNRSNLILFNENGDIKKHFQNEIYTHVFDLVGAHTVDGNNDLIYIDTNNQIKKKINTLYIEDNDNQWIYRCVYSSMLTGNLLIGMSNEDSTCSKINQFTIDSNYLGKLVQTIQYDNAGSDLYVGPCYITENNNGDIVVSDWKNGVVVTDSGGRHRFTFKKDPYGSVISPKGICTDPLSHILVCVLHKVMMLDKDGQFLSYILSMPPEIMITTNSLSFNSNTHCLWFGSVSDGKVYAFKYLKRPDALLGMYASDL